MADKQPKISVVICTRDRPDRLAKCLSSLAKLEDQPDQVVIVTGSKQSCPDDLLSEFSMLKIYKVESYKNNISISRNVGLKHASNEIVLFLDDDAAARSGWVRCYRNAFTSHPKLWIAGGLVYDTRSDPLSVEFHHGLISSTGKQIPIRMPADPIPRGFEPSVKGCNFGIRKNQIVQIGAFDPFFAFSYDESDLVLCVHQAGGSVLYLDDAVVDHDHTPGHFRQDHPLDRDWQTEYASHTMFMLKHSRGFARIAGWTVIFTRLVKLVLLCGMDACRHPSKVSKHAKHVSDAISGIYKAYRQNPS